MQMNYDKKHGSPYDRGSADRYYGRCFSPHYYIHFKGSSVAERIDESNMTLREIEEYTAGFEEETDRKNRN